MSLNKQMILDHVVPALTAQGQRSTKRDSVLCMYRTEGTDLKCAVGHLIPDENYRPELESNLATRAIVLDALDPKYGTFDDEEDYSFLSDLQAAHDQSGDQSQFVTSFTTKATQLAERFDLTMPTA